MANTTIQLKKSSTPSAQPIDLANGEIAINYADGKLFYKDASGNIQQISGGGNTFSTINAAGTLVIADLQNDILTLDQGSNITITGDAINDKITISADLTPANNWANTKLSNTSGVVFDGNLTISSDLTIGNNLYSINSAFFDTNTSVTVTKGQIAWNSTDETFDLGMANGSILQVGQEIYYRVKNQTGSTINEGTVVMAAGTLGASGRILVTPAISDGTYPSKYLMGIATTTIVNGGDGYVTHFGKIRGLDTSMWSEGDILYANVSVAGALQNTAPIAPNTKTTVAIVVSKHQNNGELFVRPTYGSKLNEDEMVELNSLTNGDVIQYVLANGRFENRNTLVSAYGVANAAFDKANTSGGGDKTYTFEQSSAPATANASDLWVNTDTGVVYENFGTNTSPVWAEFGPTGTVASLSPGVVSTTNLVFGDATYQTTAAATVVNTSAAFSHSNTTYGAVNSAFGVINAAFGVANAAFGKSNTALQNTTGTLAGDITVTGNTIINKQTFVTYRPSGTVNAAVHIAAANTKGGSGYADVFKLSNLSGGTNIDKWIRLNSIGTLEVINSAYSANIFELTDGGDLIIPGNSTFSGTKPGYAPNRPAFRVYGDGTTNINATTTLKNTNWAVDFEQGSNLNGTTGIFTAPVAGLYSVNLTARTQNNNYVGTSAIAVQKTSGVLTTNICYIEWYNNTSANHMGSSTIIKLAAGDTLKVVVTAGQVTFDVNDNWSVAYIG